MAGVLKVRDTDGTLRTITDIKVRDTDGTLRTLSFARVRDTDGTLREVFTSGGGGSGNPASISPGSRSYTGSGYYRSATYTATSSGAAPTSYSWGVLDGNGGVIAGVASATATLQVYCDPGNIETATFFCDMMIGGASYRATCVLRHRNTSGTPV